MSDQPRQHLIVFTRRPDPGRVKTRLIGVLGAEGAADLQRRMIVQRLSMARRLARQRPLALEVHHADGTAESFASWLGPDLAYRPQADGDLGRRMAESFRRAFDRGASAAILIGTDVPELDEGYVHRAFDALREHDLVLGPATDGGYTLIGLRRPIPELFEDIGWGTSDVLAQTMAIARRLGLSGLQLETLSDVDRPEDLPVWERVEARRREARGRPDLSIIIPALNEARAIASALAAVNGERGVEVFVVDGGSQDSTREVASAYGAQVIAAPKGRARQMNAGAAAARGEILLFLHADTHLPRGFAAAAREALARERVAAGAFTFALDARSPALRLIELGANLRSRWLQLPYGDQALFLRAALFAQVGGFPAIPVMEDVALIRKLRRRGRIVTLPETALTSARRWLAQGAWRTTLAHQAALAAYVLGVPAAAIARWLGRGTD